MIHHIGRTIKKTFFTGLFVVLPIVVTVYFSIFLFNIIDQILGPVVTKALIYFQFPIEPNFRIPGLGLIVTLVIVFLTGMLVTNIVGRKLIALGEFILAKIPIVRSIYSAVKQIIETVAQANSSTFKEVVIIEFPMKGSYTIGFISSEVKGEVQEKVGEEAAYVFVPTVPNITTGFLLLVPRSKLTHLDMSVEEGIKMAVSGGILAPSPLKGNSQKL